MINLEEASTFDKVARIIFKGMESEDKIPKSLVMELSTHGNYVRQIHFLLVPVEAIQIAEEGILQRSEQGGFEEPLGPVGSIIPDGPTTGPSSTEDR